MVTLFKRKGYFSVNTSKPIPGFDGQLRKIVFFLVLNTEATFKYDLMTDHTVCHLINTMPLLPKALLHACIWNSSLDRYFCECIAYTPIWFAYQFIDNVVESLKYADPYETLDRVDQLVRAIYTNIARSDFRHMDAVDKKIILNKYFDITMDLMRHFYAPDAEKFQKWSKNKYRKYMGYVLKHNLEMVLHCFELFQRRPILKCDPIEFDVYALMREREPLIDDHRECYSDVVRDTLHRMNTTLLNSLQYNVMQVDCNAFMYWVEIDIDAEHTLQRVVGEIAHKVEQLIDLNECFAHDVCAQLRSIVVKPLTVPEMIARIETIGEWIEKLEQLADTNNPNIELWLNGFIDRGDLVLGNTECLEALELHTKSLTVPVIKRLILFAVSAGCQNDDDDGGGMVEEKLIEICLNSFDQLSNAQIFELIQYSIDEQRSAFGHFQLENFDQFLIEVFNKTTFTQNRNAYLKLLFQSPQLFYDKLFDEALTTDMQMQHMIQVLNETAPIFKNFASNQLNGLIGKRYRSSAADDDADDVHLLPQLLAQLFFAEILPPTQFIVDIFYKQHLVDAMKESDFDRLELLITSLNIIAAKFKFDGMCPPLLVMSAQVLELCRWNLTKFNEQLVSIVNRTIGFVNAILKVFLPNASQNEKSWIIPKIATYGPLTRYYFQRLALPSERPPKKFDEFLWPSNKRFDDTAECVKFLCEYFVRCTSQEIDLLAKNERLLTCFWDALELVATIGMRSSQGNEVNCLKYCCNAFFSVVQVKIAIGLEFSFKEDFFRCLEVITQFVIFLLQKYMLPAAQTDAERASVINKVVKLLSDLKSMPFFGDLVAIVHPTIANNMEKCQSDPNAKQQLRKGIETLLNALPDDSESKTLLAQTLNKL